MTRPYITVKQIRAKDLEGDDTWRALGRAGWETPFPWTTDTWGTPAGLLPDDLVEIQVEEPDEYADWSLPETCPRCDHAPAEHWNRPGHPAGCTSKVYIESATGYRFCGCPIDFGPGS